MGAETQLGRSVAQHVLTFGDVKLGGEGAVEAKRQAFKAWKAGKGTNDTYFTAKRKASRTVTMHARMQTRQSTRILTPSPLNFFALPTRRGERMLTSWATSKLELMQERCL